MLPFAMPVSASIVVAALAVAVFILVAEPVARHAVPAKRRTDDGNEGLTSDDEDEVLAAIDDIAARGMAVPSLVLYHPNPAVVRRALTVIEPAADLMPHLLAHRDASVRAAALARAH